MTALTLRDYQVDALERVAAAEARGVRRQLLVAATGLGKTVMFTSLAERRGGRAIILAHRDELIEQAAAKVREVWPGVEVGIVKAERNEVHAHVVVASVQTLARSSRLEKLCAPFEGGAVFGVEPFGLVVVDEAHHAAATSYRMVLDRLRAGVAGCDCGWPHERAATPDEVDAGCELGVAFDECPGNAGPLLIGVTATPDRGDGKGLNDLFDEIVASYDLLWGIRSGYLSDVRGKAVRVVGFDAAKLKVNRGDFDQGQAGRLLDESGAHRLIVAAWLEEAVGRPTLAFTPTVEFARQLAVAFVDAGVRAGFVHAGTPMDERRQLLRDFHDGTLQVVANCGVLTEGYDEPSVSCVVVARPTKSRALYVQMVGRGTRRHPDKTDLLVLDVVGASDELSLVTVPSLFGVDGKRHRERLGDGSSLLTDVIDDDEHDKVAAGLLRAEEVDLFKKVRGAGIAWVQVHRDGDELRRYHRSLGRDQPTVVLAQRVAREDVWTAGLLMPDGSKHVLMANVSQELAQGIAEDAVRKQAGERQHLVDADAQWRKGKPSKRALEAAAKWRLKDPKQYATAGELSDALDQHIERIKARPRKATK